MVPLDGPSALSYGRADVENRGICRVATAPVTCPRCQSVMVQRTKRDDGTPFFGCSRYPACRGTRSLTSSASEVPAIRTTSGADARPGWWICPRDGTNGDSRGTTRRSPDTDPGSC